MFQREGPWGVESGVVSLGILSVPQCEVFLSISMVKHVPSFYILLYILQKESVLFCITIRRTCGYPSSQGFKVDFWVVALLFWLYPHPEVRANILDPFPAQICGRNWLCSRSKTSPGHPCQALGKLRGQTWLCRLQALCHPLPQLTEDPALV